MKRPSHTIQVGKEIVPAGRVKRMELPVARLPTGTWVSLPVAVVNGREPGPTIWLSAAIHGDELVGVGVIRSVLRRVDPNELRGTILAVPVVNVFGLVNESRYLPDRRDLNRSFPGSKRGSLASQLANLFMEEIVKKCTFGIDFHSGSGGRSNLPQLRCNLDDPETRRLAEEFGTPVIMHSKMRDGSLRAAATSLDIKTLLFESGEASRLDPYGQSYGVSGTMRCLRALGMIDNDTLAHPPSVTFSRSSVWVRARRSGFVQPRVQLGDLVGAGQPLATISDVLGRGEHTVKAPEDGIVIGGLTKPLVNRGDALFHLAEPSNE